MADQLKMVGTLSVEAESPIGLTVDGAPLDKPYQKRLPIGPHVVVLEHPRASAERWHVDLHARETVRLVLTASSVVDRTHEGSLSTRPAAQTLTAPLVTPLAGDAAVGTRWRTSAKWAGGATAMLAIAAGSLMLWNGGRFAEWRSEGNRLSDMPPGATNDPTCSEQQRRDLNRRLSDIQRMDRVGIGLGIGAVISAAVTTFLVLSPSRRAIRVSASPDGWAVADIWPR